MLKPRILVFYLMAASPTVLPAEVIITEISPASTTLRDADGDFSDWIEMTYTGPEAEINLDGWFLTDDPRVPSQWTFPPVRLPRDEFLVVYCSAKDRRPTGGTTVDLHTNFRLNQTGEYLALLEPDGSIAWQFNPTLPPIQTGTSYGFAQASSQSVVVDEGAVGAVFVPSSSALGLRWTEVAFNEADWVQGPSPFGFDVKFQPTLGDLIATDLAEVMHRENATAYIRMPFEIADPGPIRVLRLRMKFADGFVAYINGVEVARANAPKPPGWDSRATGVRIGNQVTELEDFVFAVDDSELLRAGSNVLAIHALNNHRNNNDFFIAPQLIVATREPVQTDRPQFFETPTPGFPNGSGFDTVTTQAAGSPVPEPGVHVGPILVDLGQPSANGVLHFTRDGTIPSRASELYSEPIALDASTELFVRHFEDDRLPSPPVVLNYVLIDASLAEFQGNLPLMVADTFGEAIGSSVFARSQFFLVDRAEDGRAGILDHPQTGGRAGIEVRGSSSAEWPKKQYKFEIRDSDGSDLDRALLDLPAESDWVLFGSHLIDSSMVRNPLMYEISNQMGRYAPRTRFVELFLNTGGGLLSRADYLGVYSIVEKIKRGSQRVNVDRLEAFHKTEPEVSGGYILKMDRPDPAEPGFNGGGLPLVSVYPKARDMTEAQSNWIKDYLNELADVLVGPNSNDPVHGYAKYIDVDSFVDDHILMTFSKDIDSHLLSVYMFKPRGGRLHMGPVWDFDRSLGSSDPETWSDVADLRAKGFWWAHLLDDPQFVESWGARWRQLRSGLFSTENLLAIIDGFASEIDEAQVRDSERWGHITPEQWRANIVLLKNWVTRRAAFFDAEFVPTPQFSLPGGQIVPPVFLEIQADQRVGEIFYTLDGSDPRVDGKVSPLALLYQEPIVISETTKVRARVRLTTTQWGELAEEVYFTRLPTLAISEIMYNPPDGIDFEFLEIVNYGEKTENLVGVHLGGVAFHFTENFPLLAPGGHVLLVRDLDAFESLYGKGLPVAGTYSNTLSNAGEVLSIFGTHGEKTQSFEYSPAWYAETRGRGRSLVVLDAKLSDAELSQASSWRPSLFVNGSPGRADVAEPVFLRGDVDGNGILDSTDPLSNLLYQFQGSFLPICLDAADTDDNGRVDISDPVLNLTHQFHGTLQIPVPGPSNCGADPTPDSAAVGGELGCETSHSCSD